MTGPYLYQTLHLLGGEVRRLADHVACLDDDAQRLFGCRYRPDLAQLARDIAALAAAERYPSGVSGFVRLELGPDGEAQLRAAGVSLYRGYAFRSLQPAAVTLRYDIPFGEAPTSVREAAAQWAQIEARRRGGDIALRCDARGRFREADNAPLLAVAGRTLLAAPGPAGVERRLAADAARAAGLDYRIEEFGADDLRHLDELFFVDHRGVTALSHCDGWPLMSLRAERVAAALEGLFPKK